MGTSNSVKHEEERCFIIKGVLKDTARKCTLGRNHINVVSVANALQGRNFDKKLKGTHRKEAIVKCFVQKINLFEHQIIHT